MPGKAFNPAQMKVFDFNSIDKATSTGNCFGCDCNCDGGYCDCNCDCNGCDCDCNNYCDNCDTMPDYKPKQKTIASKLLSQKIYNMLKRRTATHTR